MSRTKIVIMSDVHMNDRNVDYSWCTDPLPKYVTDFLNHLADRPDVAELVLTGDIFDTWLYPVNARPVTQPQTILDEYYPDIREALQHCFQVEDLKIYYINGNHDMSVTQEELNAILNNRMVQISSDEYQRIHPNLRIEHGHEVDMFNARPSREQLDDTIAGYPLGYFITRIYASSEDIETQRRLLETMLREHHQKLDGNELIGVFDNTLGKILVHSIIDGLSIKAGLSDDTRIQMPDGIEDTSIGDVKDRYHTLLEYWWNRTERVGKHAIEKRLERLLDYMLVSVRKKHDPLDWYAKEFFNSDKNIEGVVFGHTHHSEEIPHGESQCYANDGCWCHRNSAPTWIEADATDLPKSLVIHQFG